MCRRSVAPADKSLQGILPERQSSLQSTSATGVCTCVQRLKLVRPPPLVSHVAECEPLQKSCTACLPVQAGLTMLF